jgi:ferrous-iron efflux pump FieF
MTATPRPPRDARPGGSGPPATDSPALASAQSARLLRLATYASVATAGFLIAGKLIAWLATGSVTVLASLVDSAMDAAASLVNLLAVHWSLQPADAEHRFGHGKAQPLAALGQAVFIAGSAVFLGIEAIDRLLNPQPLTDVGVGLLVAGIAIVLTMLLVAFQRHVVRRTGSPAIRADALHYATDLATNVAMVAALVLAAMGLDRLDPLFGLAIGLYVFYSALRIARDAIDALLDRELPETERRAIASLALAEPGVRGVHGLRTRQSGQLMVIQLHLELDDDLSLVEAHRLSVDVERRIRERWPDSDVTIHQDPVSVGRE